MQHFRLPEQATFTLEILDLDQGEFVYGLARMTSGQPDREPPEIRFFRSFGRPEPTLPGPTSDFMIATRFSISTTVLASAATIRHNAP
ncbi:hypothetical protein [Noviherbaspirillum sp.]|jgi:hypothetical protein|uniref:hypothetical protein n=1 Tax=Noviherbaspirillum sp. TaxID=1926288 RepID=UPI0025CE06D2|nr:hypothetical protein [Noviherbaspirillum sp.]